MNKRNKKFSKIYKRHQTDLWGQLAVAHKGSKILDYIFEVYKNKYEYRKLIAKKRFLLSVRHLNLHALYKKKDLKNRKVIRKKGSLKSQHYLNTLKFRKFYGNINQKQFKALFNNFSQNSKILNYSFALLLECRIDMLLYRLNLFQSIFAIRQFINHGNIYVNGKLIRTPSYRLNIQDIFTIKQTKNILLYNNLKIKLKRNKLIYNYPSYIEVHYKLGSAILTKLPSLKEIPYPFPFNINTIVYKYLK